MKHIKTFEEITPVEYVGYPELEHPSYKNEEKKKKKNKKLGEISPLRVLSNHVKDILTFKGKP